MGVAVTGSIQTQKSILPYQNDQHRCQQRECLVHHRSFRWAKRIEYLIILVDLVK